MKKVKITILKTTFQEDLAKEYGVDGLSTCPLMKEGRFIMRIMQSLKGFVMRHGRPFINMCLHWLMVQVIYGIMRTGIRLLE